MADPYHDARGRFTSRGGASGMGAKPRKQRAQARKPGISDHPREGLWPTGKRLRHTPGEPEAMTRRGTHVDRVHFESDGSGGPTHIKIR
jgi:hypothetical protein